MFRIRKLYSDCLPANSITSSRLSSTSSTSEERCCAESRKGSPVKKTTTIIHFILYPLVFIKKLIYSSPLLMSQRFHRILIGRSFGRDVTKYRSEEHTSELQSRPHLVCRLLLEKK